ncbi:unnamed protein product, partial [Aphanomyces euteiches]
FTVDVTFAENEFLYPRIQLIDADGDRTSDTEGTPKADQPFVDEDMGKDKEQPYRRRKRAPE